MFERFTERARRVIILAREEAGRFRHDFVGTEHVLLGLIRDGEGIATAVLQRLGLRLETVKAEVERALALRSQGCLRILGAGQRSYAVLRSCLASLARMRCCFSCDRCSTKTLPSR